jgi:DNA polymerase III epsilon subunit-like protein
MDNIITLDIEASGLSPHSYPIEIGVVLTDNSSWCNLIKPAESWRYWSQEAQDIHQITQESLIQYGKDIRTIAESLNTLLHGKTVYSDCWVLDDQWLRKLYAEAKLSPSFTLRDIMHILKEDDFTHWEKTKSTIAKELNIERHRATNDARILQESFLRVQKHHMQTVRAAH